MLEFTQSIFFWTLINFIVLLFLVHRFALPPFYRLLEDREKKRLQVIDDLEKNMAESKSLHEQYQQKLSQIHIEAKEILKTAETEKEMIKKEILAKALDEKQKILTAIKDELDIEKKKFVDEMKNNAVNMVIECTQKIIQQEIKPEAHYDIIKHNIDELEKMIQK